MRVIEMPIVRFFMMFFAISLLKKLLWRKAVPSTSFKIIEESAYTLKAAYLYLPGGLHIISQNAFAQQ